MKGAWMQHTESARKNQESTIKSALRIIKLIITEEETEQNKQLHTAVQLIVDFARKEGYLL